MIIFKDFEEKKMKISGTNLPSNQKFGIFFSTIFIVVSIYFYINNKLLIMYLLNIFAAILLIITFTKPELLLPFNKLWMKFGLQLGKIVSPIVLGIIFFSIFMPIGILFRLIGRDQLSLKLKKPFSYWVKKEIPNRNEPFKNQF